MMSLAVRYFSAPVQMAAKTANRDGRLFVGHFKIVKTVNQAMRAIHQTERHEHRANAIGTFLDPGFQMLTCTAP